MRVMATLKDIWVEGRLPQRVKEAADSERRDLTEKQRRLLKQLEAYPTDEQGLEQLTRALIVAGREERSAFFSVAEPFVREEELLRLVSTSVRRPREIFVFAPSSIKPKWVHFVKEVEASVTNLNLQGKVKAKLGDNSVRPSVEERLTERDERCRGEPAAAHAGDDREIPPGCGLVFRLTLRPEGEGMSGQVTLYFVTPEGRRSLEFEVPTFAAERASQTAAARDLVADLRMGIATLHNPEIQRGLEAPAMLCGITPDVVRRGTPPSRPGVRVAGSCQPRFDCELVKGLARYEQLLGPVRAGGAMHGCRFPAEGSTSAGTVLELRSQILGDKTKCTATLRNVGRGSRSRPGHEPLVIATFVDETAGCARTLAPGDLFGRAGKLSSQAVVDYFLAKEGGPPWYLLPGLEWAAEGHSECRATRGRVWAAADVTLFGGSIGLFGGSLRVHNHSSGNSDGVRKDNLLLGLATGALTAFIVERIVWAAVHDRPARPCRR